MTKQELWAMVNACETEHQIFEAERVLRGADCENLDDDVWNDLMDSLAFISRELYRAER